MKLYFTYLVLSIAFFSCNSQIDNYPLNFYTDSLTFETNGIKLVNPGNTQLVATDSSELLLFFNDFERAFEFLELPTGKMIHKVHLDEEGEHGISGFVRGAYNGTDSIWFINNPPTIGLLNFEGEVLLRKKIEDSRTPLQAILANHDKLLYRHGSKIFGAQPLFMDHHGMNKKDISKYRVVFSYDFESDSLEWYEANYPSTYWDKGKKVTGFSWTERKGKLYISPWYDHEIQVFDMDLGRVIEKKVVKSKYVNQFLYVNRLPMGQNEGIVAYFANDQYSTLIYDKFRDVFYRLFLPSFDLNDLGQEYNHRDLKVSRPYLGVMVLDKDLNVLGEHVFDRFQIYTLRNHFVGEKGLYLSLNNLFHPDYDEDKFRYLIFTPELR